MNNEQAGRLDRFFVFCLEVLSEMPTASSLKRNQTSVSCGRPSGPSVANVANLVFSKSMCDCGIEVMPYVLEDRANRPAAVDCSLGEIQLANSLLSCALVRHWRLASCRELSLTEPIEQPCCASRSAGTPWSGSWRDADRDGGGTA